MKGTEKQIAWAEQIRRGVYETLDRADAQRGDRFYTIDSDVSYLSPEAVAALRSEYDVLFARIDSAAKIIDVRTQLQPSSVIKHGRDWMWAHGQTDKNGQLLR